MAKVKRTPDAASEDREAFIDRMVQRIVAIPPVDPPLAPGLFPHEAAVRIAASVWRQKEARDG